MDKAIHLILSAYVVFVIVDLAIAFRDRQAFKLKYIKDVPRMAYHRIFIRHHVWTLLTFTVLIGTHLVGKLFLGADL